MKRLILDFLRRWRWVYVTYVIALVTCWTLLLHNHVELFNVPIAFFFGSIVLSFDLMGGTAKAAYILPLTRKQIGNSWWLLATVCPVAINVAAKLIAGAIVRIGSALPEEFFSWFTLSTVCDLAYAGAFFFVLSWMPAGRVAGLWQNIRAGITGAIWGLAAPGVFVGARFIPQTWETMNTVAWLVLVLAMGLTIAGFYCAPNLVIFRASFRLTSLSGASRKTRTQSNSWDQHLVGLPRILWTAFSGAFAFSALVCVAFLLILGLLMHQDPNGQSGGFYTGWLVWLLVAQNLRWLMSLRHLRVLPLSTVQLNGLLLGLSAASALGLGIFVDVSHFFLTAYFPWHFRPDQLTCLIGFSCFMSFLVMRFGMMAILLPLMLATPITVMLPIFAGTKSWLSFLLSPAFLYFVGVVLAGLTYWLNHRSLTRHGSIYKPMKTPFGQALGSAGV